LSRELNVSIPTILGAINILKSEGLVSPQSGKRTVILSDAARGKRKSAVARRVVFLTFTPNSILGSNYYQSVLDKLRELGFSVRVYQCARANRDITSDELQELVGREDSDCWALLGPPESVQIFFANKHLPCIIDGIAIPGLPLPDFEVDYAALYRHAISQLQGAGHRRICLITTSHSAKINPESIRIFRSAVARYPAIPGGSWEPIRTYDGTSDHFFALLRSLFLSKKPAPTALIVAYIKRVAGTMTWLMKHGIRIPEDVSIIGRDYEEPLECLYPLPAHYRQPPSAAHRFLKAILAIVDRKHVHSHKRIMVEFVAGQTVAPVSNPNPLPVRPASRKSGG